jgi:hypothetical protein
MADPQQVLAQRVHDAIAASFGPEFGDADPLIRSSSFADFQANVALPLAKRLGRPPREVAGELVPRQATFARSMMRRSRSSQAWLLRQMMYRRIMLACSLWLAWSVPSRAKYRSAVNWASTRFNQDEFVGV